jgi:hypothetical protein
MEVPLGKMPLLMAFPFEHSCVFFDKLEASQSSLNPMGKIKNGIWGRI